MYDARRKQKSTGQQDPKIFDLDDEYVDYKKALRNVCLLYAPHLLSKIDDMLMDNAFSWRMDYPQSTIKR